MKVLLIIFSFLFLKNISFADVKVPEWQYLGSFTYQSKPAKAFYMLNSRFLNDTVKSIKFEIVFDFPVYLKDETFETTKEVRHLDFNCCTNIFNYTLIQTYYFDELRMTTKVDGRNRRFPYNSFVNKVINKICLN